jgi:hypothetical protein
MKREGIEAVLLPLMLLAVAMLLQSGLQTAQLLEEHTALEQLQAGQRDALRQADRRRSDFERLVTATLTLANAGNRNVLPVIAQLKQLGAVTETTKNPKSR